MRVDSNLSKIPLTNDQHYFASCWYNMVHEFSVDSFRVQAMNPGNGVRELLRMLEPPANSSDLEMVASELIGLLSTDPVLKSQPFVDTTSELLEILNSVDFKVQKRVGENKPLIRAFSRELHILIQNNYIEASLSLLEQLLLNPYEEGEEDRSRSIRILTNYLISTLLDRGASLESVFQLYRQVLSRKRVKEYVFKKRFGLLRRIITQEKRKHTVVFAIDNISNPDSFPVRIGDVEFTSEPPEVIDPTKPVSRYLSPQPRRLFAKVEVETKDFRTAGTQAYSIINNILDLVRFEYERDLLALHNEFVITGEALGNRYRIFPIPKVVPNPTASMDEDGLHGFIGHVNDFMHSPNFSNEERSR